MNLEPILAAHRTRGSGGSQRRRHWREGLALLAALAASPALAVEGAVAAELTVGRQFALNASFELSPIQDRLWLVAGYGLLKSPDIKATETTPKITTAASHLISGGVDVSPHKSWIFSLLAQGSPRATETVPINPNDQLPDRVSLTTSRQSAGGLLSIVFDTAGDSAFELGIDGGLGFHWNRLGRTITFGPLTRSRFENLFVTRPQLGVAAMIKGTVTLGVRAGYTFYSADPLTVGRLNADDYAVIAAAVAAIADRLSTDVELSQAAANTALARLSTFDALSGYPYAPVLFDLKSSVLVKFSRRFSMQLAWTWLRYVPTQGYGNVIALKGQFRFPGGWRAWIIGSVQFDEPLDQPAQRTPEDPKLSASGHLSIGAEFAFF